MSVTAGETEQTASAPVRDDAHDEGSETLTYHDASGARTAEATATGTIVHMTCW